MGKNKKPMNTRPSYYCLIYMWVKEACEENGYAATLHGSLENDLDILACPWTEDAITPNDLKDKIAERLSDILTFVDEKPTKKPHGRMAWSLNLDSGAYIDLSVMPVIENKLPRNGLHDICS